MAGWRQAIELALSEEEVTRLTAVTRSRTEPASRVERARMLLAYREDGSFFAVARAIGVHHQTVQRCVERALAFGAMAALDDLPRPGRKPTITAEAKAWVVNLARRKAKERGYPHGCSRPMCANMGRARGRVAWASLLRARCASSSTSRRSSPTRSVTTWNAVTPTLRPRWRKCCVSIAR